MTFLLFQTELGLGACGGSIINSKWVITALHCVVKNISVPSYADLEVHPASSVRVIVGEHQLSVLTETDITRAYGASEIILSEESATGDDFALIKVDGDIDTSVYTPICLPNKGDDFRGENSVVTGWGRTQSSIVTDLVDPADILQEIVLPFTTSTQCDNILADLGITGTVPNILCFGSGEQGKGSCFGDSGGPLIVQKQGQSSWTLAGTVSAGTEELCAAGGSHGIAVEVASFTDFIKAKAMDGEFCADD